MRRWVKRVLFCIVLGAIVNLAVAWVAVVTADELNFSAAASARARSAIGVNDPWIREVMVARGVRVLYYVDSGDSFAHVFRWEAGWPIPSFTGTDVNPQDETLPSQTRSAARLTSSIDMFWQIYDTDQYRTRRVRRIHRLLPLRPLAFGIVVNTLLYAGAALIMLGSVAAMRMYIRRRRGHCPRCNFDLRHDFSAGCPECGWRRMNDPGARAESHTAPRHH